MAGWHSQDDVVFSGFKKAPEPQPSQSIPGNSLLHCHSTPLHICYTGLLIAVPNLCKGFVQIPSYLTLVLGVGFTRYLSSSHRPLIETERLNFPNPLKSLQPVYGSVRAVTSYPFSSTSALKPCDIFFGVKIWVFLNSSRIFSILLKIPEINVWGGIDLVPSNFLKSPPNPSKPLSLPV